MFTLFVYLMYTLYILVHPSLKAGGFCLSITPADEKTVSPLVYGQD